jgi:hypothetical protein
MHPFLSLERYFLWITILLSAIYFIMGPPLYITCATPARLFAIYVGHLAIAARPN